MLFRKTFSLVLVTFIFIFSATSSIFAQVPLPLPFTSEPNTIGDLEKIFVNVLATITTLAGFAVFIMIIVGGFKYIMAQGDPKALSAARSTLTWAIAGFIVVVLAWFIILFIEEFTGVNTTIFRVINPFQ